MNLKFLIQNPVFSFVGQHQIFWGNFKLIGLRDKLGSLQWFYYVPALNSSAPVCLQCSSLFWLSFENCHLSAKTNSKTRRRPYCMNLDNITSLLLLLPTKFKDFVKKARGLMREVSPHMWDEGLLSMEITTANICFAGFRGLKKIMYLTWPIKTGSWLQTALEYWRYIRLGLYAEYCASPTPAKKAEHFVFSMLSRAGALTE